VLLKIAGFAGVLLILAPAVSQQLAAQTPDVQRWLSFMESNPGESRLPEDESLGLLADRRSPDSLWSDALDVCDEAIRTISLGEVPVNQIHPSVRVPLSLEFEKALEDGGPEIMPRYGLPVRDGDRITVPVKLIGPDVEVTGYIYLSIVNSRWLIDQWAVDLTPF
jgi:hypothetical protein